MSRRERILDAAAEVLRTKGAAHATTKEIARAAGCSEPLLYRHFKDKEELLVHVILERLHSFPDDVAPGEDTVEANLAAFAHTALAFYRRTFPMMGSLLAKPSLLTATRTAMDRYGRGPQKVVIAVADYLRAEQGLGRVDAGVSPDAAAALLIGACFQQAFLSYYATGPDSGEVPDSSAELAATLLRALQPR